MFAAKSSAASISLPGPAERPGADIVIYDGHCRFCTGQVERLHRFDGGARLAFLSLHDDETGRRFPDLSHAELMEQMYVVDQQGVRYGGAAAFRYLTRRLPRLWILAPLMYFPGSLPLWSFFYRQVAKQRYRWGKTHDCENGACAVHFKK